MLGRYLVAICIVMASLDAQSRWVQRSSALTPPSSGPMAFDPTTGTILLLTSTGGETWSWDGISWTSLATTGPPPQQSPRMVYDSGSQCVWYFISTNGRTETWHWTGSWKKLNPPTRPRNMRYFNAAYDEARGVSVIFGGDDGNCRNADTWEFDGTTWTQRSAGGPRPRRDFGMVYDAVRAEVVLFGGRISTSCTTHLQETWVWDGTAWREHFGIAEPQGRREFAMIYDRTRDRTVLFGGRINGSPLTETWVWKDTAWSEKSPASSPGQDGWTGAFDELRGVPVILGENSGETWEYLTGAASPSYVQFGTGCSGTAGIPQLDAQAGDLPSMGGDFTVEITSLGTGVLVTPFGLIGSSNQFAGATPLPFNLSFLQAFGCQLLVSMEIATPLVNANGVATWTVTIPSNPTFAGQSFYQQAMILDPGANPGGIVMSNGGAGTVGF